MQSITLKKKDINFDIPEFVQLACRYHCSILLHNEQGEFNAKSIMAMMAMNPSSSPITITAKGEKAEEAVQVLAAFLSKSE